MSPVVLSEESLDSGKAVKMKGKKRQLDRTGERFYCPYPGCTRSFAELWRLKVHYRAPPDVRGSGKERGHGQELNQCPRCGKTLVPGKHHTGCSQNPTLSGAAEREQTRAAVAAKGESGDGAMPEQVNWGAMPFSGHYPNGGPLPGHGPMLHPHPMHQQLPGGPFAWSEASGLNTLSTCSTTTAMMSAEQASSWHFHNQQMQHFAHPSMDSSRPAEGPAGALPPMPATAPTQTEAGPGQVVRTHWRSWAECSMQTDLGAPFWPLDEPFPRLPPTAAASHEPYCGDLSRDGARSPPQLRAAETASRWPRDDATAPPQQPSGSGGADRGADAPRQDAAPPRRSDAGASQTGGQPPQRGAHPGTAAPDAPGADAFGVPRLGRRYRDGLASPAAAARAATPGAEALGLLVPHPPSSPPDDNFDRLANMLFDFSHFDNSFKKELTSAEVELHPVQDDFMDDLYACDIVHDEHAMFKILFEDEHHNATSITSHMHRQRDWSFNLDDAGLGDNMLTSPLLPGRSPPGGE